MPLFEFVCQGCGLLFEDLVRLGETPSCPTCGVDRVERQLGAPSAHTSGGSSSPQPSLPMAPSGGFCGRGACGMPGCG